MEVPPSWNDQNIFSLHNFWMKTEGNLIFVEILYFWVILPILSNEKRITRSSEMITFYKQGP